MVSNKSLHVLALFSALVGCAPEKSYEDGHYIVVLKKRQVQVAARPQDLVADEIKAIAQKHDLPPAEEIYSQVLEGGVFALKAEQAQALEQDPGVAYIEKDQIISINASQAGAVWGLDRIDQSDLPLNQNYVYENANSVVHAYVVDTGILISHQEFQGRASHGFDAVDGDQDATDCNGHGTHVAGTVGGATYGVAKNVKLHAVRVLDCFGSGSYSKVIAGIEWVTANHIKPAVANMSLGGPISQALEDAISASIQAGVTYVVAAGNENANACNTSPSRLAAALTVGATDNQDRRSDFSNFGACVDIFAPGTDIKSSWYTSNSATDTISGTSMASPHVAGVVALYLALNPNALPSQVAAAIVSGSVSGKISNVGSGSPNRLLNTLFLAGGVQPPPPQPPNPPPPPPPQPPASSELQNGVAIGTLSGAKDHEQSFTIRVPASSANLIIEISGGSGDVDLYVKAGSRPSLTSYDCRPYKSGNSEICDVAAPIAGVYHVVLRGYSAYSGVNLKASYQAASESDPSAPCTGCTKFSGNLGAKGASVYLAEYQATVGTHDIYLRGPSHADFDIYLQKKSGTRWSQVASATKAGSGEQISYKGTAGTYRVQVLSYSGSGSFDLYRKSP